MTLEDLGNLGDFIGGLAVIATLIYLAIHRRAGGQIRQNTFLLRRSVEQTTRTDSTAAINLAAQSPENAAVFHRGQVDSDALSPEERTHFYLLMAANFYHLQYGYAAFKDGSQSERTWNAQWQALEYFASMPGVRSWWKRQGSKLIGSETDFGRLVDSEMRKYEEPRA